MRFTVIVERGEESGYVVHCPELKGCWSQGSTIPEALERISEAIAGCLEARIAKAIREAEASLKEERAQKKFTIPLEFINLAKVESKEVVYA
ncbi:MAG: type II toxin-antitoxin system HicB family antitoxin [Anaerolineae bacterium]